MSHSSTHPPPPLATTVAELLERSHRLGSDPRNTNYAGGNASAKGTATDPVTGAPVELLWVKGSGGDLGTLTEAGLSVLRLDRLRALTGVYPGEHAEDEMVPLFDHCRFGSSYSKKAASSSSVPVNRKAVMTSPASVPPEV